MKNFFKEQPEDGAKLSNWRWLQVASATALHFLIWYCICKDIPDGSGSGSGGSDSTYDELLGLGFILGAVTLFAAFSTARAPRFWLLCGTIQCIVPGVAFLVSRSFHLVSEDSRDTFFAVAIMGLLCIPLGPLPTLFIRNRIARNKQKAAVGNLQPLFEFEPSQTGVWPPAPVVGRTVAPVAETAENEQS